MPKSKPINEDASISIEKSIALAKKLLMQEVVQDFHDLKDRLENKRKLLPK